MEQIYWLENHNSVFVLVDLKLLQLLNWSLFVHFFKSVEGIQAEFYEITHSP